MRLSGIAGFVVLFLMCISISAHSCTTALIPHYVLRDFGIQLHDWRDQPLPGTVIVLSPSGAGTNPGPERLVATTDTNGVAR